MMIVRLFSIVILLFGFSDAAFSADKVESVSVQGNRYIETAAILNKIKIKAGAQLSQKVISRDVRRLYATGYFSDVYVEGERLGNNVQLTYVVSENPVIASVKLEGNDEVSKKKILPFLKLKAGVVISPLLERMDTNKISKIYLKKGFYQEKTEIITTRLDDGRVDVVIRIHEGGITRIKEIQFIGNQHYTHSELADVLATGASNLGTWFTDRDVFNRDRFAADAQLIQQHYLEHGFLDVRVDSTRLTLTPNMDDFYLGMTIHEGDAFTVSGIEIQGDLVPSKEALMTEVKLEVGKLYALSKMQKTIRNISEKVGDEGYAFVNVTPSFHRNLKDKTVDITFDIEKGREVYIERIQISGNDKTQDHVIRRELRQYEGSRYKASAIRRGKERVQRLSFMKKVSVSNASTDNPKKINLDVEVEEGKSGKFSAGISYSQTYGVGFTGSVSEQNLLGGGYQTSVSADLGGRTNNYSVSLTDPYFFRDGVSGTVSLFRTQTDLQTFTLYTYDTQGGSVGMGFALNEYARYSVGYRSTKTTVSGVPATSSFALRSQEGTFVTGELTQTLSYDTRNRTLYPSDGGIQSVSFGYAGLTGDRKFYETTLKSKNYIEISDFWTLRGTLGLGSIKGYGGLEAPVYRKYSLGGVGTVRGYDSFGISLVEPTTLDVLGGNYKMTSSLDLIFPLPYMGQAGFRGTFFVDAGTVWGTTGAVVEKFDAAHIRASFGFGIEWASPVGPLTMAWGFPINRQTNDKVRNFEFSLGQSF